MICHCLSPEGVTIILFLLAFFVGLIWAFQGYK